jgi:PAS domain S-box-containing protein
MKFRSSLFLRGVILVAFPVTCQILIVLMVMCALVDVERKLERESQSGQVMFLGGSLLFEVADAFFSLGIGFGVEEDCFTKFQKSMNSLSPQYKQFVTAIRKHSQNEEAVRALDGTWRSLLANTNSGGNLKLEFIVDSDLSKSGVAFLSQLHEFISSMLEVANDREIQATQVSIEKLQNALSVALAASVAVTLMLWYLYSISIEKPLMHLIENGRRLSTGLPLLPNLTGAVELSKVDKVIREVSNSIGQSVSKEKEAIANSGNLICSIDEDAVFINVNPYVKELLDYDPDEIIGLSLHEFIDQRSDFNLTRTIGEAIKSGTTYEFQVRLKHRRNYWVDTRWSCLYSPIHGSFFSVVQDIGEEIRIQQLKEDFSRTVSDELRTPLAQLQGSLNAMLRGEKGDVPDSVASVLERSKQNVDRLLLLTNDLLDFQRLSGTQLSLNIAMHDSTSIIKEALDSVSSLASTKEIEVLLPADSVKISCDRMRIVQILANLFSNAIKFSPRGSKVEVKLVKQENRLEVLVIDSGPGIQSKDRERIFQAFEQVSSAHSKEGTGLGLAICKMFVEAHGGTIQASSTSSDTNEIVRFSDGTVAGTVFTISLPL